MTKEMKQLRRVVLSRHRDLDKALDNHRGKDSVKGSCSVCNMLLGQIRSINFVLELTSVKPFGEGNPNLPSDYPIEL